MSLQNDNSMVPLPPPFSTIPRLPMMFPHPSPIEPLHRLTQHLSSRSESEGSKSNSNVSISIKRDDCNSGLGGGGNKIRKLEYVLADAVKQGADTLVTTGGVQSNHMRQTAAAGKRVGMEVRTFVEYMRRKTLLDFHATTPSAMLHYVHISIQPELG